MAFRHIIAISLLAPAAAFGGVVAPGGTFGGIEGSVPAGGLFSGTGLPAAAVQQLAVLATLTPGQLQSVVQAAQARGSAGALAAAASRLASSPAAVRAFANLAGISEAEALVILTALGGNPGSDEEDS